METKNLNTKYCVGLGEILFDVLPSGSQLGGAPANFAYHAGQHGLHSVAVSAVGKDALGETALRILDEKKLKYVMLGIISRSPVILGRLLSMLELYAGVLWHSAVRLAVRPFIRSSIILQRIV